MENYVITCCSTVDLTKEQLEAFNVKYICFNFELDGVPRKDDLYTSISPNELYTAMANGSDTKTSQVSIGEYIDFFTPFLKDGKDILHVCLSSGISGTYNSALLAKEQLVDEFPDRKIYIIDSLAASSGYGLLIAEAADKRDEGLDIDALYQWIEDNKLNVHHWFFSSDLTFFIKGGRISKAAGLVGSVLKICPLMNVDNTGHLIPREKIRTKKKAIKAMVDTMLEHVDNGKNYTGKCYMSHSNCYEDTKEVAELIEESIPNLRNKIVINNIGATIGSHTGPGTVALFFIGDKRTN